MPDHLPRRMRLEVSFGATIVIPASLPAALSGGRPRERCARRARHCACSTVDTKGLHMRLTGLRLWRMERGFEAGELSRRTGIESCRLTRIEVGSVEPSPEELNRISAVLRVPAPELYGDGLAAAHRLHAR
jgi:hypothetical protein